MQAYNGNAVVVDVCSLVQFLFQLGMFGLRPVDGGQRCFAIEEQPTGMHSRNTTGVQRRLVDALGNHGDFVQRGRVEIVLLLLRDLLLEEIAASIRGARGISANGWSRSGVGHASNNGPRPADELSNCLRRGPLANRVPSCRLTRLVAEWVSGRFSWAAEKVGLGFWLALAHGWNAALDTVLDVWLHSLQEVHDEKKNDAWNGATDLGALHLTYTISYAIYYYSLCRQDTETTAGVSRVIS